MYSVSFRMIKFLRIILCIVVSQQQRAVDRRKINISNSFTNKMRIEGKEKGDSIKRMIQSNHSNDIASSLGLQNTHSVFTQTHMPLTLCLWYILLLMLFMVAFRCFYCSFFAWYILRSSCMCAQPFFCSYHEHFKYHFYIYCTFCSDIRPAFKFTFKSVFLLIFFVQTLHVVIVVRGPCRLNSSKHRLFRKLHKNLLWVKMHTQRRHKAQCVHETYFIHCCVALFLPIRSTTFR